MNLSEQIRNDLKDALRARDRALVETLRMITAAVQRREVDTRTTLDDAGVIQVIEKLVRQGEDAAEQFAKGGRDDLVQKERRQIAVYRRYLPEPLSAEEVERLIEAAIAETGAASMKDMGRVMGRLKGRLQGRADLGKVSARVRARLGGR